MDDLQFEVSFAIFAFVTTRYILPKSILSQKINYKEMIVLAICYGICSGLRKTAREWNTQSCKESKEKHNKVV